MDYQIVKQKSVAIKELLSNDKLREAIKKLIEFAEFTDDKELRNSVIIKNANFNSLNRGWLKGIAKGNGIEKNNLINSLLSITDEIETELLEELSEKEIINKSPKEIEQIKFVESSWNTLELDDNKIIQAVQSLFYLEKYKRQVFIWDKGGNEITKEEKEHYIEWISQKRKLEKEEILNGTWIKISNSGEGFLLNLFENNTLKECSIHSPQVTWEGKWELKEGVLLLEITNGSAKYSQIVLGNKSIINHSGYSRQTNLRMQSLDYFQALLSKNHNNYW